MVYPSTPAEPPWLWHFSWAVPLIWQLPAHHDSAHQRLAAPGCGHVRFSVNAEIRGFIQLLWGNF